MKEYANRCTLVANSDGSELILSFYQELPTVQISRSSEAAAVPLETNLVAELLLPSDFAEQMATTVLKAIREGKETPQNKARLKNEI